MSFLGISSSPRHNGNSERLLNAFLAGVAQKGTDSEIIRLNNLNIRPCQACDTCASTGMCILQDDMQPLYSRVASCKGLVLATPIYFGTLSAQLKIFIDRFQCWWHARYNLKKPFISSDMKKPAFFISVGALKNKKSCENAAASVKVFFHVLNFKYKGNLCFLGFDAIGSIEENPEILRQVFQAGVNLAVSPGVNSIQETFRKKDVDELV